MPIASPMWNPALSPLVKLCWSRDHFLYKKVELFMIRRLWLLLVRRAVWSQLKVKIAQLQVILHSSRVWTNLPWRGVSEQWFRLSSWQRVHTRAASCDPKFECTWSCAAETCEHSSHNPAKFKQSCSCSRGSNPCLSSRWSATIAHIYQEANSSEDSGLIVLV